ncbi:MAG: type I-E CRISPR-associated endonuclease Cas1 [Thermomicrobiales bacterium]|nr:type I-E CRISPR-associated endonuclease Cas1 [Thermomicrobiales bacterium]
MEDLHILPKIRDSWSYLYVDHAKIEQEAKAIAIYDAQGKTPVPCTSLMVLMLGPGTTVSHAAMRSLAEAGCLVFWTGEQGVRFYAQGLGETRSSRRLLKQAMLWADPVKRLDVVFNMYRVRFAEQLPEGLSLQQVRGMEGVRIRDTYARKSRETGVEWTGRSYKRTSWKEADPINRALSAANSTLYGICQAAIVAAGYSTALGFVHTGKMLSFVYDIADLYKVEITIPAAFDAVADNPDDLERRVRLRCRDLFHEQRLLSRIVDDIDRVLSVSIADEEARIDSELAAPGGLWDPTLGIVPGGENYAAHSEEEA